MCIERATNRECAKVVQQIRAIQELWNINGLLNVI